MMNFSTERNWQMVAGERQRTRGWTVRIGGLVVRYGLFYDYGSFARTPDLRLLVLWRPERPRATTDTPALLIAIFPRATVAHG